MDPTNLLNGVPFPVLRSEGGFPCLHIPRPSLNRPGKPPSQEGSHRSGTSSEHSTQSGRSGSLLLSTANLMQHTLLTSGPLDGRGKQLSPPEVPASICSSNHFTVVNGMRPNTSSKHGGGTHLTTLVLTMSVIFLVAICFAVLYVEMRWKEEELIY